MRPFFRLTCCLVVFTVGYQVIQYPPLRDIYAPWDKLAHATAFFSVWWMLSWASGWHAKWVSLLCAFVGGAIEIHQMFLPGFIPSWADWFADLVGIALACLLWEVLRRLRGAQAKVTTA